MRITMAAQGKHLSRSEYAHAAARCERYNSEQALIQEQHRQLAALQHKFAARRGH